MVFRYSFENCSIVVVVVVIIITFANFSSLVLSLGALALHSTLLTFFAVVSFFCGVSFASESCTDLPAGFLLSCLFPFFFVLDESGDSLRYHIPASPVLDKE